MPDERKLIMSKLAILGGRPVTKNLMADAKPKYDVKLERKYLLEAYDSGIWDDWPFRKGSQALLFKKEFARFHTAKHCSLLTNGTHTLQLALEALDIGFGDEVIVPGMTWQATASAVVDVNAIPVIVDIDPETFCIDIAAIKRAITNCTKAIIPVHLFGRCADMDVIMRIARKHKLHVIEDCAHAHGSRFDGRGVGSIGDFGSFSFQRSKTMTSGEGGALITNDTDLYRKIESMRMCGREYEGVSLHNGNYRMTSFQAAILRGQLTWFKKAAPQMDKFHRAFDKAIAGAVGVEPLRRNPRITRQCGYGVGFRYDCEAFDGLSGSLFRKALRAETGIEFGGGYTPLSTSDVYHPDMKKRVRINKGYLNAIDPRQWKLPVAWDVHKNSGMIAGWGLSLMPISRIGTLIDAIEKIYKNCDQLLANAKRLEKET